MNVKSDAFSETTEPPEPVENRAATVLLLGWSPLPGWAPSPAR